MSTVSFPYGKDRPSYDFSDEELDRQLASELDNGKLTQVFLDRDRNHTVPDRWQAQIPVRLLARTAVIYVSDASHDRVWNMHVIPAHSIGDRQGAPPQRRAHRHRHSRRHLRNGSGRIKKNDQQPRHAAAAFFRLERGAARREKHPVQL